MPVTLTQPTIGSTNWGTTVNQNWQKIQDGFSGVNTIGPINMEDGSGKYLRVPSLTTTQRDALTAADGMVIYNTDNAQFERYQAGAWGGFASTISMPYGLENISLTATDASNTLVISVKQGDGSSNPSSSSPAKVAFRNSSATSAGYNIRSITSSLSLTISAGSSLGLATNAKTRLWVGLIDNSGTVELCVWNPVSGTNLRKFTDNQLVTTTAEGGSGGADSAQTLYSATARTSVPFRLLGFVEVQIGSSSNWSNAPTKVQVWQPGMPQIGDIVQTLLSTDGAVATGTTTLPFDDTIPQNTEGDQYMSQAITPTYDANILRIGHSGLYSNSAANRFTSALFQDSTANALKANDVSVAGAAFKVNPIIYHEMQAGTTSSTTFKIRSGGSEAGTTTFNGASGGRMFGGVANSWLKVEEIMA